MAFDFQVASRVHAKSLHWLRFDMKPGASGFDFKIYDGAQPTSPSESVGSQVLLATVTAKDTNYNTTDYIFAAPETTSPGAVITSTDWQVTFETDDASVAGTAAWFRTELNTIDGSVGTSASDLLFSDVVFGARDNVTLDEVTIRYA